MNDAPIPANDTASGHPMAAAGDDAQDILHSMFQMSPLPMVLTDPDQPDSPIVFVNPAFTKLTGYQADEVIGRNCRFLQGDRSDPVGARALRDAIVAGTGIQIGLWNYRKDGTAFWNLMFVGPVRDGQGKLLYWFGSQMDGTARLEADEAKARAQRMDTLGLMAAGIAHDFNNLMTVAIGNIEAVGTETLTSRQTERLGRVEWAARAAGRLTQQMLSFAGRQALEPGAVDLTQALRDFDALMTQAAADSALEFQLAGEPLVTRVDLGQFELALINLIRNASDASPSGSPIVVSTKAAVVSGVNVVEIAVADHGTGMPPDVAARAIEPFFTTKAHGKGTGLGLSMVSGFCQQSGGRMAIESDNGGGTTIRLTFPRLTMASA